MSLELTERWSCSECGDEMHPKFRTSHRQICATATQLIQLQLDRFLDCLFDH